MSDEPSGLIAQLVLIATVVALWAGVIWGVWSIIHGWRP